MKRAINLANRLEGASVLDLERDIEQDGLSQLSRDAIERLRERVVLREIIVSIHLERPSEHPERASGCDDRVIFGKQEWYAESRNMRSPERWDSVPANRLNA